MNKLIAIAIDEYKDPNISNLKNCWNDINNLLQILTTHYFEKPEIILFNKLEQTTLSFLYRELNQEIINSLPEDNILIMYAGHGDYNRELNTSYWYCSDSKSYDPTTWFDIRNLLDFFRASKANHISLISDSCFSGAIFENYRGGGLEALTDSRSRQALTSGGIEIVSDGSGDNSPFNITLTNILSSCEESALTFSRLSEEVITSFNPKLRQTPRYGSLVQADDKGGTFVFNRRNLTDSKASVSEMTLSLDIDTRIEIDTILKFPFFNKKEKNDNSFINNYVHQIGYSIINQIRKNIADDLDYYIERSKEIRFDLQITYTILRDDDKFLSVLIEVGQYFGTAYPNYWVETANFTYSPIRKFEIDDLLDGDTINVIRDMVSLYAEQECKDILLSYIDHNSIKDIEFSVTQENLILYFYKLLPHALTAMGCVEIPLNEKITI